MPSYLSDTFRGGISPFEDRGLPGAGKFVKNIDIRKDLDSLSCQYALIDETSATAFNSLATFIVPCTNGKTYAFFNNGRIYERQSDKSWTLVYTDTQESTTGIIGAAEFWEAGSSFLYWATATRLNRKPIPGNGVTPWNDVNTGGTGAWPKTNLTSSTWHTMREVLGALQVCNGSDIAQVSYGDSSYTTSILGLVPGNISQCLIERGTNVVVGCNRKDGISNSGMFVWDGYSDAYLSKRLVPVNSINALIDIDVPLMQVGSNGAVYYSDTNAAPPIFTFPGGGKVNPGGVCNDNGIALFGVFGNGAGKTGIYSYGQKKGGMYHTLSLEYALTCDEIGAVCKVGDDILVSYKSGTDYGIKRVNTAAKATGIFESLDFKAPPDAKLGGVLPMWEKIIIKTKPLPGGTKIYCSRRINKDGIFDTLPCNLISGADRFETAGATEAVFLCGDKSRRFEYQITLVPSSNLTPEVLEVEVVFS